MSTRSCLTLILLERLEIKQDVQTGCIVTALITMLNLTRLHFHVKTPMNFTSLTTVQPPLKQQDIRVVILAREGISCIAGAILKPMTVDFPAISNCLANTTCNGSRKVEKVLVILCSSTTAMDVPPVTLQSM